VTAPTPPALPDGPATSAAVAAKLGGVDVADVDGEVAAVNAMCAGRWGKRPPVVAYVVDPVTGDQVVSEWGDWQADTVAGANLLAVRLYSRRNSPAGVAVFGAEGAAYVSRNDPDVAQLLQLGSYTPPRVG
jgi:hypothetical protein